MDKGISLMEIESLIQSEIDRVKNNQTELYALDRKRAESMANIERDVAEIKVKNQNMETDISELKTDMSELKKTTATKEDIKKVNENIQQINTKLDSHKWQTSDKVAVITALISLIGVIIVAVLGSIK